MEFINWTALSNRTNGSAGSLSWLLGELTTLPAVLTSPTSPSASVKEARISMTLFLIMAVVGLCALVVHALITTRLHLIPESIAVVVIGAIIGLLLRLVGNWREEEAFPPTMFFLVLLPPIIFESGYNLHKGNFFQNIGSITVFAIFGTIISAAVIGGGLYLCGKANLAYKLNLVESFAFGSLISAVDPVATLAIFQALDVDPILYMLVFGESILNDAVSIVLMTSVMQLSNPEMASLSGLALLGHAVGNFCLTFLTSAAIGIAMGLISALLLKWIDLRRTPSLEVGMMLIFSYMPYCLTEALRLSGIMAILFSGIVMSHYTHHNLSPVTQITIQQMFRTIAFMAETCVFAYLGLAIFSFKHRVEMALVIWCLVLCLLGRALNIFPLALLLNRFREHKITRKNQFIMWFSGLRGAIAFALSLHLDVANETRQVLFTTTLIIVLSSILFLGGGTMPMMKFVNYLLTWARRPAWVEEEEDPEYLRSSRSRRRRRRRSGARQRSRSYSGQGEGRTVTLSKTKEMGDAVDSETTMAELTEDESTRDADGALVALAGGRKGFLKIDADYLIPFFTRRFTQKEVAEGRKQMSNLTDQWYKEVRAESSGQEDSDKEVRLDAESMEGKSLNSVPSQSSVLPRNGWSLTNSSSDIVPLLSTPGVAETVESEM